MVNPKFFTGAGDGNAGPLRLRSGQAFYSAEERFAQDDRLLQALRLRVIVGWTLDSGRPKMRGGQSTEGVEGLPGTGCPLDPGPGLGGILSLGLFAAKASPFLNKIPIS